MRAKKGNLKDLDYCAVVGIRGLIYWCKRKMIWPKIKDYTNCHDILI